MLSLSKRLLHRLLPAWGSALSVAEILWIKTGWFQSAKRSRPLDSQGRPLPWLTYPALAWLDQLDLSQCRIFEYGAGWGTLHWAWRALAVTAVERSPAWIDELRPKLPAHVTLHGPMDGTEYIECARKDGPWDVVIVDGSHRLECARVAVEVLVPGGLILLDNADWFTDAADFLRSQGLTQVDFQGFGPCNPYTWTTSVFLGSSLHISRLPASWSGSDRGAIPYQP
ncbi:MAG: hypothetical protein ABL974_07265 [Prosthecobacter sp.]